MTTTKPGARTMSERVGSALTTKITNMVEMIEFFGQAVRSIPRTRAFTSEVLRQTGILIISSGMIIWFMQIMIGAVFAVEGNYLTRQFGAPGYVGIFPALGGLRTTSPEMWGWILAAKVGCGLVAEIGSARISEEIDALEVMGIDPRTYLIGTRLLSALIAMPFLYVTGVGLSYISSYFMIVHVLGTVSQAGFFTILWAFQNPLDLLFSMIWGVLLGTLVILVGCYYGYTASGGPVGVGKNTAKSMLVNMVLVSVIGLLAQQLFWGGFPNAPIAN
jgi:phospholipid/cholesterol/gamma-HCH transport system permease protein